MPDKTKWVNEWKQKAENDLRTAEIVLSSEEPLQIRYVFMRNSAQKNT